MSQNSNRRDFLKTTGALGVGFWVAGGVQAAPSKSPNERTAMASIGLGGKGTSDSNDAATHGDMVAICDVDEGTLNGAGEQRFTKAKRFHDFRKMLEEMGDQIDAVTVSTADHTHAPAALMAMRMKKHCFCQKPLTRTVYEARLMGRVAREMGVATQMGNQGTAGDGLRRGAALLRAGALGAVQEIHIWTNRPIWPQGQERPQGEDPTPDAVNWDLWLGPAPVRPYKNKYVEGPNKDKPVYHPFVWRGWWDFGSGALGDMGCHEINMPFMGLDLRNPTTIQAITSGHKRDAFPAWSIVTYKFPATDARPAVKLVWYDGGKKPSAELLGGRQVGASGTLIIGEKGRMNDGGRVVDGADKDVTFPKSPGHFEEWVRAIRGGEPAMSNFPDYAGPLAETVLLGNLAVWVADKVNTEIDGEKAAQGEPIEWDAEKLQPKTPGDYGSLVKPTYRAGYTLDA